MAHNVSTPVGGWVDHPTIDGTFHDSKFTEER
jgi:hypothetical protein